jgi:hypothetical protein
MTGRTAALYQSGKIELMATTDFADATDQRGLSATIRRISGNLRLLPLESCSIDSGGDSVTTRWRLRLHSA